MVDVETEGAGELEDPYGMHEEGNMSAFPPEKDMDGIGEEEPSKDPLVKAY